MKKLIRDLTKRTIISIGLAMAIFCFVGVIFDIIYKGNFNLVNYQFTQMVIGCMIVGLGFGLPSIVYHKDSLPMPMRVLIHLGIGCTVYTFVACSVGWLGNVSGIGQGLLVVALQLGVAIIIWFLFLKHYRKEAKKLNDKIQHMK